MDIKKLTSNLASPKIFFYALFWLMFLLTWGTIAQKDMGLYQSQLKFFSSWWLWIGPIPTPGGRLTMTVITMNLFFKLFFKSPFRKKSIGVIITHIGSMALLAGGVLTAYFSPRAVWWWKRATPWGSPYYHEHD